MTDMASATLGASALVVSRPVLGTMSTSIGLGLMAWSPVAGGLLSGKYDPENPEYDGRLSHGDFLATNGLMTDAAHTEALA